MEETRGVASALAFDLHDDQQLMVLRIHRVGLTDFRTRAGDLGGELARLPLRAPFDVGGLVLVFLPIEHVSHRPAVTSGHDHHGFGLRDCQALGRLDDVAERVHLTHPLLGIAAAAAAARKLTASWKPAAESTAAAATTEAAAGTATPATDVSA